MKPSLPLHPVQRDANGRVHLVTTQGHKWLTCVVIDFPIRLVQLPADDHRLIPLTLTRADRVDPYPVKRAIMLLRRYAKESHGITDGAKAALDSLKDSLK